MLQICCRGSHLQYLAQAAVATATIAARGSWREPHRALIQLRAELLQDGRRLVPRHPVGGAHHILLECRTRGAQIAEVPVQHPGLAPQLGEIDILARRGKVLAVIEVKSRGELATAATALAPRQRRRIARAAEAFLLQRSDLAGLDLRFDLMLVAPLRLPRHWRGAWRADD